MITRDLGLMPYRDAFDEQQRVHAAVLDGAEAQILLVEHPPVITFGRRGPTPHNLRAPPEELAARGVEVVESDRGGDVTLHAPGQLVAYPILRLADAGLTVGGYVRALLAAVVDACRALGVDATRDDEAIGVWADDPRCGRAKLCALGVRVRRGVSLHGVALNVTTDLALFDLIVPCGLPRPATSLRRLLADATPPMAQVKRVLSESLRRSLAG